MEKSQHFSLRFRLGSFNRTDKAPKERSWAIEHGSAVVARVVAYLPADLMKSLGRALRPYVAVIRVREVGEFQGYLDAYPDAAIVIDPENFENEELASVGRLLMRNNGRHVVVYTAPSLRGLTAYKTMLVFGVTELIMRGVDDDADRIRELIIPRPVDYGAPTLLDQLEGRLAALPTALTDAIGTLFLRERMSAVQHLADAAELPRRTTGFHLARAAMPSAETLIHVARVMRACYYLRVTDVPIARLAAFLGYRTKKGITREVRRITGYRPCDVRRAPTMLPIIPILSRYLAPDVERSSPRMECDP